MVPGTCGGRRKEEGGRRKRTAELGGTNPMASPVTVRTKVPERTPDFAFFGLGMGFCGFCGAGVCQLDVTPDELRGNKVEVAAGEADDFEGAAIEMFKNLAQYLIWELLDGRDMTRVHDE
jgi:hypothetical protein